MPQILKLSMSRRLIFGIAGLFALIGGSAAAAYYVGAEVVMGEQASLVGAPCSTVLTMVSKTPSGRLWLRKYIRTDVETTGDARVRTALRIAAIAAKANKVDLVQVNVVTPHGPTKRAQMRGRAIAAQVTIGLKMDFLPDLESKIAAQYYDGDAGPDGEFHGDLVKPETEEVRAIVQSMAEATQEDCVEGKQT